MSKFTEIIPEYVRAIQSYVPGKSIRQVEAESGVKAIKLASNENPFGPSLLALSAMRKAAAEGNLYPDNQVNELRQKLAERHRMRLENIIVTAGSTSLLENMARTLLSPGLNAISSERSFIVYPIIAKLAGGQYRALPMKHDAYDLDAILAAIDANTRLIFLANPNNPTGTLIPPAELDRFVERLPNHVVLALDEAYFDFADYFAVQRHVERSHALEYVRQSRNVVVLRTFSKTHGLAGIRVGYGMGPAELVSYLILARTAFMVSSLAEAAALAAMDNVAHIEKTVRNNFEQSQWLLAQLRALGYKPVDTWSNFIFCEVGESASEVAARLQAAGVIIRAMSGAWGAPTAIRVTVGTPEQNQRFVAAFKKVVAKAAVK